MFTCNVWCILIIAHILLSSVKIGFTKKCFDFILRDDDDDDDANLKMEKKSTILLHYNQMAVIEINYPNYVLIVFFQGIDILLHL